MKRQREGEEFIDVKSQRTYEKESVDEYIERVVFMLKTGHYDFSNVVECVFKHIDIINYAIMTDDDILLSIVAKNWIKFPETFERNKVIYKRLITTYKSQKCYTYFKNVLGQKFKPDYYYNNTFCSYIK